MSITAPFPGTRRLLSHPIRKPQRTHCRPRRLADAMVLVAAMAAGLSLTRPLAAHWATGRDHRMDIFLAAPCVLTLSLALLTLRLRRPRAGFRRIARQPGTMACLAVAIFLALRAPFYLGMACLCTLTPSFWVNRFVNESLRLGYVVPVAWFILLITRRRRPEPGWIDRLGRILGAYWIALVLVVNWFDAQSVVAHSRTRPPLTSYLQAQAPPVPMTIPTGLTTGFEPRSQYSRTPPLPLAIPAVAPTPAGDVAPPAPASPAPAP